MIDAFENAFAHWLPEQRHIERFSHTPDARHTNNSFNVVLVRAGRSVLVPPEKTILEALRAAGVSVTSSCEQGICGACEVGVVAGIVDHRDRLLSEEEKASGKSMLICCSRSKGEELVLDY